MKIRFVVISIAILSIAACASAPQYTASPSRIKRVPAQTDTAYVNAVEAAARRNGVGVIWVHPPRVEVKEK